MPQPGDVIGKRFELIEQLGQGGHGSVWLAKQLSLNDHVALKLLRPELVEDDELQERFRREAQVARTFKHRNIAQVYDYGLDDDIGTPYISAELIGGESIKTRLARKQLLAVDEGLVVLRDMRAALAEVHARGVAHRDVQPGNIMLTPEGFAVLVDFGIASRLAEESPLTPSGIGAIGVPEYIAPERLTNPKSDARPGDLFSLGVVLWRGLTGDFPYGGRSSEMHRREVAHDLAHSDFGTAPSELRDLLAGLLEPRPSSRATLEDIEQTLSALSSKGQRVAPPRPVGRRRGTRTSRAHSRVGEYRELARIVERYRRARRRITVVVAIFLVVAVVTYLLT